MKFSLVWSVPIVALILTGLFAYRELNRDVFEVTVTFKNASGVTADKTILKYRNIEVGKVNEVAFSKDLEHVIVTLEIKKFMRDAVTENTKFWIERPQIGLRGVQGLDTILSGVYVALLPKKGEKKAKSLTGLETPPISKSSNGGLYLKVKAGKLGNIKRGSLLFYKNIGVGHISDYRIDDEQTVEIEIFIESPYDKLIGKDTYFWRTGNVNANLSGNGVSISLDSLEGLFFGAISFNNYIGFDILDKNQYHNRHLFKNLNILENNISKPKINFTIIFKETIEGLSKGAPVEYFGIPIGKVTDFMLIDSEGTGKVLVIGYVLLDKLIPYDGKAPAGWRKDAIEVFYDEIKNGLVVRLSGSNLLSGSLKLVMEKDPTQKKDRILFISPNEILPEKTALIPSKPSKDIFAAIGRVSDKVVSTLQSIDKLSDASRKNVERLDHLPVEGIVGKLDQFLDTINQLSVQLSGQITRLEKMPLESSVGNLNDTVASIKSKVDALDTSKISKGLEGLVQNSDALVKKFDETLIDINSIVKNLNQEIEDPTNRHKFSKLVKSLENTVESFDALLEYINRNPETFIYGKKK